MMLHGWGSIPLLTVPWLNALQNLTQLITDLVELVVNLLRQRFMLLFQPANLFFKTINPFMMNVFRHSASRGNVLLSMCLLAFGKLALPLPLGGNLYDIGVSKISKVLSFTLTENLETSGVFSKDIVQAQTPARRNDLVGIQGTFVVW